MKTRKILMKILNALIRKEEVKIDKKKVKRILIIKLEAIGDVIRTTPLIREIKKEFPKADIDILLDQSAKDVIENNPNIKEIITVGSKKIKTIISMAGLYYNLSRKIKKNEYDIIFNLTPHYFSTLFNLFCGGKINIGFDRNGEGFGYNYKVKYDGKSNETLKYLEMLKFIGRKPESAKLDLFLTEKNKKHAENLITSKRLKGEIIIGIAPIGRKTKEENWKSYREWSKEKYEKLSERLIDKGYFLIFFGTKNDTTEIKEITENLDKRRYMDISGKTTILDAAALIEKCGVFISHDTGIIHIASATSTPLIVLFGPTEPLRFRPIREKCVVIHKRRNGEPIKYDVYGRYINCEDSTYMERITVGDVEKVVERMLSKI